MKNFKPKIKYLILIFISINFIYSYKALCVETRTEPVNINRFDKRFHSSNIIRLKTFENFKQAITAEDIDFHKRLYN